MIDYQIKLFEASIIAGISKKMHVKEVNQFIPGLWQAFDANKSNIPHIANSNACFGFEEYGTDFMQTMQFEYMPAMAVSKKDTLPENFIYKEIPGGLHAVFTHRGSIATIKDTFTEIYNTWLHQNGKYTINGNYDFEFYDHRFKGMAADSELEIWVPIKAI